MSIRIQWDKVKVYVISILIPLVAGAVVGLLTSGSSGYDNLNKPMLAPPAIVFPIAWSILYTLMGISHGILITNRLSSDSVETIYYSQLIVNLLWPILFFLFGWRLVAFFWILLLDVLAIIMTKRFYQLHKTAGLLQLPYCVWLIFASYLNLATYLLNR